METLVKTEEMVNNSNQPQQTKKIRKHITDYEYFTVMGRYVNGKLTDEQIKELEEDIKTWELFRIKELVGMSSSDIDGIPTPLLRKEMRGMDRCDWNGGEDGKKHISCFTVEQFTKKGDEENLHKSQGTTYKNLGEMYRTLNHQVMMYRYILNR